MSRKSILSQAGFWVANRLQLLEMISVALLLLALVIYNYTNLQYNQLIIVPLLVIAIVYYLNSFAFSLEQGSNIFEIMVSKLVYLFACIGFLGLALEYVQNSGARIMLLIAGIAELLFILTIIISQIARKASFPAAIFIRTIVFTLLFSLIYVVAYGLIL